MKTETTLALAIALSGAMAASSVGCVAHAQAEGYTEAEAPVAFSEPPTLVEVDPDVWVVSDYDYPVYYVGDSYWVYRDNVWYHSHAYDGGWARADVGIVPATIVRRDPRAYVHYHASAGARTRVAVGGRGAPEHARPEAAQHGPEPRREAEPQRAAEPQRGAEPGHPAEPQRAAEPQRTAEPQRAAEPQRTAEPQRAAGPPARPQKPAARPAKKEEKRH